MKVSAVTQYCGINYFLHVSGEAALTIRTKLKITTNIEEQNVDIKLLGRLSNLIFVFFLELT